MDSYQPYLPNMEISLTTTLPKSWTHIWTTPHTMEKHIYRPLHLWSQPHNFYNISIGLHHQNKEHAIVQNSYLPCLAQIHWFWLFLWSSPLWIPWQDSQLHWHALVRTIQHQHIRRNNILHLQNLVPWHCSIGETWFHPGSFPSPKQYSPLSFDWIQTPNSQHYHPCCFFGSLGRKWFPWTSKAPLVWWTSLRLHSSYTNGMSCLHPTTLFWKFPFWYFLIW